jgi:hypothetical protein
MEKLTPMSNFKFEADVYATNFFTAYRDLTTENVQKDDQDPAETKRWKSFMLSPDQPGRFQKIRQTEAVRKSPALTRFWRYWDSWFEDEEFRPGLKPLLKRSIPFSNDVASTWINFYKTLITKSTFGYAVYTQIFHIDWSWSQFMWFTLISPWFINTPNMWLNRFFRQQGMKPMATERSKAYYAVVYSSATMWTTLPFMMYFDDFGKFVNSDVVPVLHTISEAIPDAMGVVGAVGATIVLSPRVRAWIREKISKQKNTRLTSMRPEKSLYSDTHTVTISPDFCELLFQP